MTNQIYSGDPIRINVEASMEAVYDLGLDILEGQQYSRLIDVIAIEEDGKNTIITTCRSIEKPSRPVYEIPTKYIEKIHGIPTEN